jgi:hypothetical protein
MKGLLIKTLMLFPKIIDKIGKINTMHQLKSLKNSTIHHSFRIGKNTFLLLSKDAKITIENQHPADIGGFFYQIDYNLKPVPENAGYFCAQWRREPLTGKKKDYTILDQVRGRGQYIGTYVGIAALERYWWGEGEMKFYLDGDVEYPTICGTGTEDYFGGAWSYAGTENGKFKEQNFCTPFIGYPFYSKSDSLYQSAYFNDDCPPMRGLYWWHTCRR